MRYIVFIFKLPFIALKALVTALASALWNIAFIKNAVLSFIALVFGLAGIFGIQEALPAKDYFSVVLCFVVTIFCASVLVKKFFVPIYNCIKNIVKRLNVPENVTDNDAWDELLNDNSELFDFQDNYNTTTDFDNMDGSSFERFCARLLSSNNFQSVELTAGSGDQGVDIVAVKDGVRYAVQCKRYSHALGNTPIQEVNAGKTFYNCHVGAVMTNQYFTKGGQELATKTGTLLWDRDKLIEFSAAIKNTQPAQQTTHLFTGNVLKDAANVIFTTGQASVSLIARRLKLDYEQAMRVLEWFEENGVVGAFDGKSPRKILITRQQWQEMAHDNDFVL